jgi:hypothetical protein
LWKEDKDERTTWINCTFISLDRRSITASLFNENLIPHLQEDPYQAGFPNPAKLRRGTATTINLQNDESVF